MPAPNAQKIIINDWSGGLSPRFFDFFYVGQGFKIGNKNQYNRGTVNPLNLPGFLVPGFDAGENQLGNNDAVTGSGVFPNFVTVDDNNVNVTDDNSTYTATGNEIHAIDPRQLEFVNTGEFPHDIDPDGGPHSGHSVSFTNVRDMLFYQVNGAPRLCYFFTDNSDGDMGTYDLASSFTADADNTGGVSDENVWDNSSGGSSSDFNPEYDVIAELADNGFVYVANGTGLHRFDGTVSGGASGTVTTNVLQLPSSRYWTDMVDGLGLLWIVNAPIDATNATVAGEEPPGRHERDIRVVVWNRQSTGLSQIEDSIPIRGATNARGLFFFEGVPHIFTRGTDGVVQLRKYNGREFAVIKEVGGSISTNEGYPAHRRSIVITHNGVMWIDKEGSVFYYGKPFLGVDKALYKIGDNGGSNGALARITAETFVTGGDETAYYFDPLDRNAAISTTLNGFEGYHTKVYELPKLSVLKGMTVFWVGYNSANDVNTEFDIYTNFNDSRSNSSGDFSINHQNESNRGFKYFPMGYENVNAFSVGMRYTNTAISDQPFIYRIEFEYVPTNKDG